MSNFLLSTLPFAVLPLVIPLAIIVGRVVGRRLPNGVVMVVNGAAAGAFITFWFMLGGIGSADSNSSSIAPVLVLIGGLLLMVAGDALAVDAALRTRRRLWTVTLGVASCLLVPALNAALSGPGLGAVCGGPDGTSVEGLCGNVVAVRLLILAGMLAGPTAALAFGLGARFRLPRRHGLPEGLQVEPLGGGARDGA